jgi:hypothetical protein
VQSANVAGGTAGKLEAGDTLTYTFSEPMLPASVLGGWAGAATPVVVTRFETSAEVVALPAASVAIARRS